MYIVELNNSPITAGVEEYKSITIIPFVLKLKIFSNHVYYQNDYNMYIKYELGATIDLGIQAYKCYNTQNNKKILVTCVGNTKNPLKKEISDVEYTLLIKETRRGERIAYSGEFSEDISSYFSDKGQYLVRITGTYNNVESAIYFWIEIV
ncbi:MAG: hypothetical protein PHF21_00305 [Bacilli bacterium]|nr:hypothetical protein [Bacilli bacterium]